MSLLFSLILILTAAAHGVSAGFDHPSDPAPLPVPVPDVCRSQCGRTMPPPADHVPYIPAEG